MGKNRFNFSKIYIRGNVFFALFTVLFAGFSCTERIHIETDPGDERLVVYGYITSDTLRHAIRITRSSGYFATTPPEGVSDAFVTIATDDETYLLTENKSVSGLYETTADVYGIEGKEHTLYIALDFDNDGEIEEFESSAYMPFSSELDRITLVPSTLFDDVIEIKLYGKLPPNDPNCFSFHAYRNNKILNDSLGGFFVISDEYFDKTTFGGVTCFYLDQEEEDTQLTPGDVVRVRVDFLTEEYKDFLDHAQKELGGTNPIFGGPPANVQTNIRPLNDSYRYKVSGFFAAYSGSEAYTTYKE
ncbi:DUF4249 domain-containing protein [Parabacteroides sp. OttesenSCG-928-G21]|nr:DUF4249 domain-containing protein [Parabacteroides sp. OttesenSCG-928-G21]